MSAPRNVLRRWAATQTDPRLTWVNPIAPLLNLRHIAAMLLGLWHKQEPGEAQELASKDLEELWELWFRPFVGTGKADGWLDHVDLENSRVAEYLTGQLAHDATALCWLAIRPGKDLRSRRTAWQPYLRAGLEKNLIDCGTSTLVALDEAGFAVDADQVETQLLESVEYIDDDLWCELHAADLGLDHLALKSMSSGQQASVRLDVAGVNQPLHDPRIPALIGDVRQYRTADAVALYGAAPSWRIVVATGDPSPSWPASVNRSASPRPSRRTASPSWSPPREPLRTSSLLTSSPTSTPPVLAWRRKNFSVRRCSIPPCEGLPAGPFEAGRLWYSRNRRGSGPGHDSDLTVGHRLVDGILCDLEQSQACSSARPADRVVSRPLLE